MTRYIIIKTLTRYIIIKNIIPFHINTQNTIFDLSSSNNLHNSKMHPTYVKTLYIHFLETRSKEKAIQRTLTYIKQNSFHTKVNEKELTNRLQQQVNTYVDFLNQVFPFWKTTNYNAHITKAHTTVNTCTKPSETRLKIGEQITFQINDRTYNGIVVEYSDGSYLIFYLNGDCKWHSVADLSFWKKGHPKWDTEAFRVKCHYNFRPTTYYSRQKKTIKNHNENDDDTCSVNSVSSSDSECISSESEWLPSDSEPNTNEES